jgi:ribose 1,5-bisphosphokinase PhnN
MRRRFVRSAVVLVTAPRGILAERIRARGRDVSVPNRLDRELEGWAQDDADLVIDNSGDIDRAAAALVLFVKRLLAAHA